MHRLLAVVAAFAPVVANASPPATTMQPSTETAPPLFDRAALAVAHFAADLDLPVPHDLVDRFVLWQHGLRDMVHGATDRIAAIVAKAPQVSPDLTILTTQPIPDTLSSGYGWRDDPIRHTWKFHGGTDFKADPGTPVGAAGDGVVVFAGRQGGYGNVIYVDHGGGVVTLYGHLRRIETKKGATVTAGERIGQVGQTGRATGPHLHFEVRLDNRPVDPVTAMTVADLERTSPIAGHLAAFTLAPEVQHKLRARDDRHADPGPRPERAGRGKRTQVNW
jgi:murein DD-endopeptidase MepM/ murein hydrolase activator NlpD